MPNRLVPRGPAALERELLDELRAERVETLRGPESAEGRALAAAIGANVARLRAERGIALESLAVRTGIREDLLLALERGEAVPSLRAVWSLATGLCTPFAALLADTFLSKMRDTDFAVVRQGEGRVISSADGRFRSRVLAPSGDLRAPEVYELTLEAGCTEAADPHAQDTFEHITVIRGTLVVRRGTAETRLEPGDSIYFRADVPHGYLNPGPEDTVALLVMHYQGSRA